MYARLIRFDACMCTCAPMYRHAMTYRRNQTHAKKNSVTHGMYASMYSRMHVRACALAWHEDTCIRVYLVEYV